MKGFRGKCAELLRAAIIALILGHTPGFAADDPAAAEPSAAAGQPAAGAEPQAKPSLTASLMKYGPSYVVMVLLVGLGTFIACAPRPGALAQTDAGKDKGPGKK
jgi:hypothetical protein